MIFKSESKKGRAYHQDTKARREIAYWFSVSLCLRGEFGPKIPLLRFRKFCGQANRPISTGQLNPLLDLHTQPIYVVVFHGPDGEISSRVELPA